MVPSLQGILMVTELQFQILSTIFNVFYPGVVFSNFRVCCPQMEILKFELKIYIKKILMCSSFDKHCQTDHNLYLNLNILVSLIYFFPVIVYFSLCLFDKFLFTVGECIISPFYLHASFMLIYFNYIFSSLLCTT